MLNDKIQAAVERIRAFEPQEGYYLAFSGGKDSQCIYELSKMAGVRFDAHYNYTSVDPPELVRFIKERYPDVQMGHPRDKDGNCITMWSLIAQSSMPPTATVRYCCEDLKEAGGEGRLVMTGVRWEESLKRSMNNGMITVKSPGKKLRRILDEMEIDKRETQKGGLILNLDNSESRRVMEMCYRTSKTILNPIIDWYEDEVWRFLNDIAKVPHCSLYDEGYTRLGCIGCPQQNGKRMRRDFERWPKYKNLYIMAFQRMVDRHPGTWKDGQDVYDWWVGN